MMVMIITSPIISIIIVAEGTERVRVGKADTSTLHVYIINIAIVIFTSTIIALPGAAAAAAQKYSINTINAVTY